MDTATRTSVDQLREELRGAGLRVTGPRLTVLRMLREHPHSDAESLTAIVREHLGSLSKQAVYDILAAFCDVGLARRIEPAGHPARYEGRVGDNHHHMVCRHCSEIEDVECEVGTEPCLEPPTASDFAIDEAEVTFWGVCAGCRGRTPAPTGL